MNQVEKAKIYVTNLLTEKLASHHFFHNVDHTLDVANAVQRNCTLLNVDKRSSELAIIAAYFHDVGYINGAAYHEEVGVKIFKDYASENDFSSEEIDTIEKLILSTQMPQTPSNKLEKILCDADLDYLGRMDFMTRSHRLFQEWNSLGIVKSQNEFDQLQVHFFKKHEYHLPEVKAMRTLVKMQNLQKIIDRISQTI